jgi:WD40 repeat protein
MASQPGTGPGGSVLATTSLGRTARLWDTATGRHRTTLSGGRMISARRVLAAVTTSAAWLRTPVKGHTDWVTGVAFSPDGTLVATASADGAMRFWDIAATNLATLCPFRNGGYAILLPDGSYKLEGDPDGELWWVVKLARFEPGEVDKITPAVRRLPAEAPLPWAR